LLPQLADQMERERIRSALDRSMVVEAAAGTGKTTELVHRIVAVLAGGDARVDSIVAVTFTEKAAGELKLRMRAGLEEARHRARAGSRKHRHLEEALARLEEARVGTIHAFCADLLRERSIEAQVDPRFETMTEPEAERLFGRAFDSWLQQVLAHPPEGVRRSLRRSTRAPGPPSWAAREAAVPASVAAPDEGPVGRLRRAGWTLTAWRDFPAAWRRDPFDRVAQIDRIVQRLHAFEELSSRCARPERDNFYLDTQAVRQCSRDVRAAEAVRPRDEDGLEAAFVEFAQRRYERPRKGYGTRYAEGVSRQEVLEVYGQLHAAFRDFARAADADLAALLHAELREAIERYERLKERTGKLDFVDLLIRARDLIRDRDDVRSEFQRRFTHLFVDEFQDTDPLQAEILLLLAATDPHVTDWRQVDPVAGKLFLVADPKQSIYRFRRADLGIYLEVKELLQKHGAECVHLTTSFRSRPAIQQAVNSAFARVMDGNREAQQAAYVPLTSYRDDPDDQPTLVALPVPRPYGKRNVTKSAIDRSLPDAVAAFVEWLIQESGWSVSDRETGERVAVSARHVCLLLRRFDSFFMGDVTRGYVRALEARGIRHLLAGGRSFHEREEVETLRTALTAIEWPDDELALFATLHGSLFAIGDEELLEYRHRFGRLHPFRLPPELEPAGDDAARERLAPIVDAMALLARLHRRRNERPIAETIHLLLEATRAHAGFALRPSGEQVLANVLHVAEQARGYEREGGISFRGFVERLDEDAAGRRVTEAPILEEGSDGVRIMTVHKAKGLEFPVVVLADITANLTPFRANRWIAPVERLCAQRVAGWTPAELLEHEEEELQRDAAEGVRIAYVAATRARDLLVVPAVGDGAAATDGWISPLNAAIYPAKAQWTNAFSAPGCPELGDDSVLERPFDLAMDTHSVRPGRHTLHAQPMRLEGEEPSSVAGSIAPGRYDVVWWDPAQLRLDVPATFGIRQEELLGKDADPARVDADTQSHLAWEQARAAALERASVPTRRVQTATERARREVLRRVQSPGAPEPEVDLVQLPVERMRPSGPRFGALVHTVLALVPLDAARDRIDEVTALQARILGATTEESAAAGRAVFDVLRHPLLARARRAASVGMCRRETPVAYLHSDGTLLEGVVDLAFLEEGCWIVVDFKTDQELEQQLSVYEQQIAVYAEAIAAATGQPTRSILMRV
jgi:ATP-dependent exoDNAse (exonuclease V) beta subunit